MTSPIWVKSSTAVNSAHCRLYPRGAPASTAQNAPRGDFSLRGAFYLNGGLRHPVLHGGRSCRLRAAPARKPACCLPPTCGGTLCRVPETGCPPNEDGVCGQAAAWGARPSRHGTRICLPASNAHARLPADAWRTREMNLPCGCRKPWYGMAAAPEKPADRYETKPFPVCGAMCGRRVSSTTGRGPSGRLLRFLCAALAHGNRPLCCDVFGSFAVYIIPHDFAFVNIK